MTAVIYNFKEYVEKREQELLDSIAEASFSSTGSAHMPDDESIRMIQTLTEVIATCEYCERLTATRR